MQERQVVNGQKYNEFVQETDELGVSKSYGTMATDPSKLQVDGLDNPGLATTPTEPRVRPCLCSSVKRT